jgi:TatD DNase family protein
VELGFYVSFAGILTFKSAQDLRDIAARVPLDRILVETDSPYLAPVPHRGHRNEPAYVVEVARTVAELHGVGVEEVERVTASNTRELFRFTSGC